MKCHGPQKQRGGLRLDGPVALQGGDSGAAIVAGKPAESPLLARIASRDAAERMPPEGEPLSPAEIQAISKWIESGAVWPSDKAGPDEKQHWSLQAVVKPPLPQLPAGQMEGRNAIDRFVITRLSENGLQLSVEADRRTLIRRLSFDLIGLPPTPEETTAFVLDPDPHAYEKLVERLLASPRHGERWAQHWLDAVRFAESDGFETNKPRANAWPYRDWVIAALNADKPYDRFVVEQLAGDVLGADAAMGFLVAGANDVVTSPDPVLTAQQRADVLHDMVSTTGSAFLGLTVGCARCHNHKFDPISQADYYAMKAALAGVQHGERALQAGAPPRDAEVATLRARLAEIELSLARYAPLATPGQSQPPPPSPKRNEERFEAQLAQFVRFTIHTTAVHPSLGEIEPCIDELEVWTAGDVPQNIALASAAAKATASGEYAGGRSEKHRLEFLNDGQVGNSRSWIASTKGTGWVQLELPRPALVDRIVWGRDRNGQYDDRLPLAYTIELGLEPERLSQVAGRAGGRPAVHPRLNIDRFEPVTARKLRMTIHKTNSLEPCIDEMEVFTTDQHPRNVALAAAGTKARASSTYSGSPLHKLEHINDGQFGNSRSWISAETGAGWVELEFAEPVRIDTVRWGRDREEKYADRLPLEYSIGVAVDGPWQIVATHHDRETYVPGRKFAGAVALTRLAPAERARAASLLEERTRLDAEIKKLTDAPKVYAGVLTPSPAETHRFHRGDPMRPREAIAPGGLHAIPVSYSLDLATEGRPQLTEDQRRRLALARWVVDPVNPLTARVAVNRLWQHHFGEGLVGTPSDFGVNGARPSHPELLDWLAAELVEHGWSLRHIHRLMVCSATYRQASQFRAEAAAVDAQSQLLWRYVPRRLEAEPLRDAILAVSGKLDLRMGGPGFLPFEPNDNYVRVYNPKVQFGPEDWRRMIYMTRIRMHPEATFGAFDCPDGGQIAPRRSQSTTPLQALNLLNSPFLIEQARFFALRLQSERPGDTAFQIKRGVQLVMQRDPDADELAAATQLAGEHGLAAFCRALFNANEFLYVD
jgi:hypothetical protein